MGGTVSSRAITSIVSAVISLGLMAWALFLIDYGWDLRQSGSKLMREGAFTFLAGGVLLFVAALAGIIHAGIKLRRLARRCQSSGPVRG